MSKDILLSSAYLAPVSYYGYLYHAERVFIEQHDYYSKQTYRNRCCIATANGRQPLTIPVERTGEKIAMRDLRISEHGNWRHVHWQALVSAYDNSPFFMYYADDIRPFYEKRWKFLIDFNEELQHAMCTLIDLQLVAARTTHYNKECDGFDLREAIHPKLQPAQIPHFTPVPYYQVFEHKYGFLPDMSIIDLLFTMGPESLLILRDSISFAPSLIEV